MTLYVCVCASKHFKLSRVTPIRVRVTSLTHTHTQITSSLSLQPLTQCLSQQIPHPFSLCVFNCPVFFFLNFFPSCLPSLVKRPSFIICHTSHLCLNLCVSVSSLSRRRRGSVVMRVLRWRHWNKWAVRYLGHWWQWRQRRLTLQLYTAVKKHTNVVSHTPYCSLPPFLDHFLSRAHTKTHTGKRKAACPATISTFTGVLARPSLSPLMSLMTLPLCLLSA